MDKFLAVRRLTVSISGPPESYDPLQKLLLKVSNLEEFCVSMEDVPAPGFWDFGLALPRLQKLQIKAVPTRKAEEPPTVSPGFDTDALPYLGLLAVAEELDALVDFELQMDEVNSDAVDPYFRSKPWAVTLSHFPHSTIQTLAHVVDR